MPRARRTLLCRTAVLRRLALLLYASWHYCAALRHHTAAVVACSVCQHYMASKLLILTSGCVRTGSLPRHAAQRHDDDDDVAETTTTSVYCKQTRKYACIDTHTRTRATRNLHNNIPVCVRVCVRVFVVLHTYGSLYIYAERHTDGRHRRRSPSTFERRL